MCLRNSWEPKLLQNKEINSKYFPAKDLICKGQSSNNIKEYYNSNSPMVQYYTGGIEKINSPNLDNNNFVEQNFNVIKRGSFSDFLSSLSLILLLSDIDSLHLLSLF